MFHDPQYHARTDTKPRETWRDILLEAADLIEQATTGMMGDRPCIIQAISKFVRPGAGQAMRKLEGHIGGDIIPWNDAHTKAQVLTALRGCAGAH